jgi:hypothetical protein
MISIRFFAERARAPSPFEDGETRGGASTVAVVTEGP